MILNLHIKSICRRIFLLLLFIGVAPLCFASGADSLVPKYDSSAVELRKPDPAVLEKVYNDDAWDYTEEKPDPAEETFFDRLLNNLLESLFDDVFDGSGRSTGERRINWWTVFFILIGVLLIVLFVLKATGTGGNLLFKRKTKRRADVDASVEDVDIHAINYESQINEAVQKKDFRLAVRLWFLRSLKELADRELIKWTIDKTNTDYYYELGSDKLQPQFGRVSLLYDYIWYGDFEIDDAGYRKAEDELKSFHSSVVRIPVKS